ncbi:MAG: response regulator transcription factor [Gammaproteobacteria bacterium]|jgi:DNA-binding NarL/FixJ family response regulator|nr:response regulator transcription factor [Gammaproteobacteria bacterium]
MIKVMIADDHPVVRTGLRTILEEDADISVCDEAGSGPELLERLSSRQRRSQPVHAVVMDITMPGRGAAETIRRVKEIEPDVGVLVLSLHPPEQYAMRLLRCGASAYLTKETAPELLTSAVRTIVAGRRFLTPEVGELIADQLTVSRDGPEHQRLSDREYDIFCRLASGMTVKEIGEALHISPKTVSTYRRRIFGKMSLRRNADITHYAVRNRLID